MRSAIYLLILSAAFSGCATSPPLPANLPDLVDLASERIENQSVVQAKAMRMVLDEAAFTRDDLSEARTDLQSIDRSGLTTEQQQVIEVAVDRLRKAEASLTFSDAVMGLPAQAEAVSTGVRESLAVVSSVISEKLEYEQQVQRAIEKLKSLGE